MRVKGRGMLDMMFTVRYDMTHRQLVTEVSRSVFLGWHLLCISHPSTGTKIAVILKASQYKQINKFLTFTSKFIKEKREQVVC